MDPPREDSVAAAAGGPGMLSTLDAETASLVALAALLAGGSEAAVREQLAVVACAVRASWVEEVILQTCLFAGFPRALNGAREWRRLTGRMAPEPDVDAVDDDVVRRARGEAVCRTVYGPSYEQLRVNIRALHPALDRWMIEDGYGKVLSRASLDLARRELCIVAACAMGGQDRQLRSHLLGALHAGASAGAVSSTLDVVAPWLDPDVAARYRALWAALQGA